MPHPTKRSTELLGSAGLRKTDCRLDVLALFLKREHSLSHAELEVELEDYDRVTLYRTLSTFEEKGILHKILDSTGISRYAICHEACSSEGHHDEHVHFKCSTCGETSCIESVAIPEMNLPEGFRVQSTNLLIEGICANC